MPAQGLTGRNGAVSVGGALIAKLRSWEWTRERDTVDIGGFGDEYEDVEGSRKRGNGNANGIWAKGDATGQGALETAYESGTSVALDLQLESGKVYTINAFITSLTVGAAYDGATTFNFNFVQKGAPTTLATHV